MDTKVVLKQKELSSFTRFLFGSSSDIVYRNDGEETVEDALSALEAAIVEKVDGAFTIYSAPAALSLTTAATPTQIFNSMADKSMGAFNVTTATVGTNYPATDGTLLALRISKEYGIAFYQAKNANNLYTGVYYRASIDVEPVWSGWKRYDLTFDSAPTAGSSNPVTSAGIKEAIAALQTELNDVISKNNTALSGRIDTADQAISGHTGNVDVHVTSAQKTAWSGKQDKLTFDTTPTAGSTNPVTSGGVKTALDEKSPTNHNHGSTYAPSSIYDSTTGKIVAAVLPSYVDDVIDGTLATFPATGEAGKIYVDTTTNKTYRWSGSVYVEVGSGGVALGETSATAYRGDRGKIAYDHSQAAHARSDATAVAAGSNGQILINSVATTVYTHPTYTRNDGTSSATLASGSTFTAIVSVTSNNGHITEINTRTYTMPTLPGPSQSGSTQPTNQAAGDLWFQTL